MKTKYEIYTHNSKAIEEAYTISEALKNYIDKFPLEEVLAINDINFDSN